jgi:hypothetical protein
MTKEQHRDKESSAQSHRKKSTEAHDARLDYRSVFLLAGCGIVNLARHCLCRKVTTKARIAIGCLPVAREQ